MLKIFLNNKKNFQKFQLKKMRFNRVLIIYLLQLLRQRRHRRRFYIRPVHAPLIHTSFEIFDRYYNAQRPEELKSFCRFTPRQFDLLLEQLQEHLTTGPTHRRPIDAKQRLAVFLRFLSSGLSFAQIGQEFKIGKQTVCEIVHQVANQIIIVMNDNMLPIPNQQTWLQHAQIFEEKWNFPRAIGCLDGKHFRCKAPPNTGSAFFNCKGFFSVVMLALVGADYKFLIIDVGSAGRNSDSGLYESSEMRRFLEGADGQIPNPSVFPGRPDVGLLPYVILADGGFALKPYMMRPFTEASCNTPARRTYNTRLSSARRLVESAFGILAHRFRLFLGTMQMEPDQCTNIIHAAVILHNFLLANGEDPNEYDIPDQQQRRVNFRPMNAPNLAKQIQQKFVTLFSP